MQIFSRRLIGILSVATLVSGSAMVMSCSDSDVVVPPPQEPGTVGTPSPSPSPSPSASVSPSPSPSPSPMLPVGIYGGVDIQVTVTNEKVEFKYPCAVGEIDHPIELNSEGGFDTEGTYKSTAGPVPPQGYPTYTAEYVGTTGAGRLVFQYSFTDADGNEVSENFDATLGAEPDFQTLCAFASPTPTP